MSSSIRTEIRFAAVITCEGCMETGSGRHVFVAGSKKELTQLVAEQHVLPTVYEELDAGHSEYSKVLKLLEKRRWSKAVDEFFGVTGHASEMEIVEDATCAVGKLP